VAVSYQSFTLAAGDSANIPVSGGYKVYLDGIDITGTTTVKNGEIELGPVPVTGDFTIIWNSSPMVRKLGGHPVNSEHLFCQGSAYWDDLLGELGAEGATQFASQVWRSAVHATPEAAIERLVELVIEHGLPVPSRVVVIHRHDGDGYLAVGL